MAYFKTFIDIVEHECSALGDKVGLCSYVYTHDVLARTILANIRHPAVMETEKILILVPRGTWHNGTTG